MVRTRNGKKAQDVESIRLQVLGLLAQGMSTDARLVKVEQTLALMIASSR